MLYTCDLLIIVPPVGINMASNLIFSHVFNKLGFIELQVNPIVISFEVVICDTDKLKSVYN